MRMTSAQANKMLKQLNEEKTYWVEKEHEARFYIVSTGEEAIIPEYDYEGIRDKIAEIDEKTIALKHAINRNNIDREISFAGKTMTIDMALIRMAQLSNRKGFLDTMRKHPEKKRVVDHYKTTPHSEYEFINYDISTIEKDYAAVDQELSSLQIALDDHNHSVMLDIDI